MLEGSNHYIFLISGFSKTGKDTIANRLTSHWDAVQINLVDSAKRHVMDIYGFTSQQVFGPSEFRNAGDLRYPKPILYSNGCVPFHNDGSINQDDIIDRSKGAGGNGLDPSIKYWTCEGRGLPHTDEFPYLPQKLGSASYFIPERSPEYWLSPREVLQKYCGLLDDLHPGTWAKKSRVDHLELRKGSHVYSKEEGLKPGTTVPVNGPLFTCASDIRKKHDIRAFRENAKTFTPVFIRVKRPGIETPPFDHPSETEQTTINDDLFDFVVNNDGTIEQLNEQIDKIVEIVRHPKWTHIQTLPT